MKGPILFTEDEVKYLKTLPAVANATQRRITYSRSFKLECLRRDRQGESPTKIFRSAGLSPALIGAKRIERSFARWRSDPSLTSIVDAVIPKYQVPGRSSADPRDVLIREQALRIMKLEHEVLRLQGESTQ